MVTITSDSSSRISDSSSRISDSSSRTSGPSSRTSTPLAPGATRSTLARAFPFGALDGPALADLDRHARWRSYGRGAHIGEPVGDEDIFLVAVGRVRLARYAPGDRSVTLRVCGAGRAFMFLGRDEDDAPRGCATALDKGTVVCRLSWRRVRAILAERPGMALRALDPRMCTALRRDGARRRSEAMTTVRSSRVNSAASST